MHRNPLGKMEPPLRRLSSALILSAPLQARQECLAVTMNLSHSSQQFLTRFDLQQPRIGYCCLRMIVVAIIRAILKSVFPTHFPQHILQLDPANDATARGCTVPLLSLRRLEYILRCDTMRMKSKHCAGGRGGGMSLFICLPRLTALNTVLRPAEMI